VGIRRREFAICAGSVGMTMANFFVAHGLTSQAAAAVPAMVRTLEQARVLAGA
jgi:hypothetical protein